MLPDAKCGSQHIQIAAQPHVPGTLERSGRVSGVQRMDFARSAVPSCLKAVTSRCAALCCAGSRTRFRCAHLSGNVPQGGTSVSAVRHPLPTPSSRPHAAIASLSPSGSALSLEQARWVCVSKAVMRPRWGSRLDPRPRDAMRSRMTPGMSECDFVDNIPISAILCSLFTQEGTLPERSVAGWGGGACAGGVPLRRPGRPPESGLRKRLRRLCAGCELARPGLRRGRVRERLKARRRRAFPYGPAEGDGERRSGA